VLAGLEEHGGRCNPEELNITCAYADLNYGCIASEHALCHAEDDLQLDVQALHRLRERRLQERTALCNQIRGLLAEYGLVIPKGVSVIRRQIPALLEDAEN